MKSLIVLLGLLMAGVAHGKILADLTDLDYGLRSGLIQSLLAKELCSCLYVARMPQKACEERSNLNPRIMSFIVITPSERSKSVVVRPKFTTAPIQDMATATFRQDKPQLGCVLRRSPVDSLF